MSDESPTIDKKNCLNAFAPAQAPMYVDAGGWTAVREQAVHEPGPVPIAFEVIQAAVEFPSADAASKALANQTAQWASCSGQEFTTTYPGVPPVPWKFGPLTAKGNLISMNQFPIRENNPTSGPCQRAVKLQRNMIADVFACRIGVSNQGCRHRQRHFGEGPALDRAACRRGWPVGHPVWGCRYCCSIWCRCGCPAAG